MANPNIRLDMSMGGGGLMGGSRGEGRAAYQKQIEKQGDRHVDLQDPAAIRAEATRLSKMGDRAAALAMFNQATKMEQNNAQLVQQQAAAAETKRLAEIRVASKGQLPEVVAALGAIKNEENGPYIDNMIKQMEVGAIDVSAGVALLRSLPAEQKAEARAAAQAQRGVNAEGRADDASIREQARFTAWDTQFKEAQGDKDATLAVQHKMGVYIREQGNDTLADAFMTDTVMPVGQALGYFTQTQLNDPEHQAYKRAEEEAMKGLEGFAAGEEQNMGADYPAWQKMVMDTAHGQGAAFIQSYQQRLAVNKSRGDTVWQEASRTHMGQAQAYQSRISDLIGVNATLSPFSDTEFSTGMRQEVDAAAFTQTIAASIPSLMRSSGLNASEAMEFSMGTLEKLVQGYTKDDGTVVKGVGHDVSITQFTEILSNKLKTDTDMYRNNEQLLKDRRAREALDKAARNAR